MNVIPDETTALSLHIVEAYWKLLEEADAMELYAAATDPCFGIRLMLDDINNIRVRDIIVEFTETSGSAAAPESRDKNHEICGYLPDVTLNGTSIAKAKLDDILGIWEIKAPPKKHVLEEDDESSREDRLLSLIERSRESWDDIQAEIAARMDSAFYIAIDEIAERWVGNISPRLAALLTKVPTY